MHAGDIADAVFYSLVETRLLFEDAYVLGGVADWHRFRDGMCFIVTEPINFNGLLTTMTKGWDGVSGLHNMSSIKLKDCLLMQRPVVILHHTFGSFDRSLSMIFHIFWMLCNGINDSCWLSFLLHAS